MTTPSFDPQPCCPDGVEPASALLVATDNVCAVIGGVTQEVIRKVVFDAAAVQLSVTFTGADGGAVVPDSWVPGLCTSLDTFTTTGLCLGDGTPIGVINRRTDAGVVVQDGYVNLLTGAFASGIPPVGTGACGQTLNVQQSDVLCDITTGDGVVHGLVLIQYHYAADGTVSSTDTINATTGAPYVPVGTITVCPTDTSVPDNDMQVLCDRQPDGSLVPFIRDYRRSVVGVINGFADYTLPGVPYVVTGTVQSCIPRVTESIVLCDSTPTRFLRTYTYSSSGAVSGFTDATLAGAAFVPVGAVTVCPVTSADVTVNATGAPEVLCDSNGTRFVRTYHYDADGLLTGVTDSTLAGAPFAPVGAVGTCTVTTTSSDVTVNATAGAVVLCDSTPTRFLRTYHFDADGLLTGFTDTTLAGAPFAPVGAVSICALSVTSTDVTVNATAEAVVLCDSNGTAFVRTYHYDADGLLTGTTDSTLAGAAFVPVGAVGTCTVTATATLGGSTVASTTLAGAAAVTNGTTVDFGAARSNVTLFIQPNGAVTAGLVGLQGSQDGLAWVTIATSAMLTTGVNQWLSLNDGAFRWFRGVVSESVTGGGSVTATLMFG